MSQDEIVFDEVRYREPARVCRPDRDRRYACLAYELPGPDDLPIFLDRRTADAIERHALRDTTVELGGILLGKECIDPETGRPFVWVTESLEAKHYENTQASFTYTHDSWEEITRERDRLHPELDVVGWYHTHPDFGVFLSGHDLFIHQHFFAQPLQVAYVVDPIRQARGFFQWRGGTLAQVGGYYLVAGRGERIALARAVNDLESVPNQDGGGGGLSPRLEAELLAMLNRSTAPQATAAERTLTAAIVGLLGMLAGAFAVIAVLWLNQLTQSVQNQSEKLDRIAAGLDRSGAAQRLALESLLTASASQEKDPEVFLSQYKKTIRALEEAQAKLEQQATINGELAARVRALEKTGKDLAHERDLVAALAKRYEADAKDATALRERLATLESEALAREQKLSEQQEVVDSVPGRRASALLRRYDRAWYAAVAGWGVALLLALGLLAAFGLKPISDSEAGAEPDPAAPPGEGRFEQAPPHRIT